MDWQRFSNPSRLKKGASLPGEFMVVRGRIDPEDFPGESSWDRAVKQATKISKRLGHEVFVDWHRPSKRWIIWDHSAHGTPAGAELIDIREMGDRWGETVVGRKIRSVQENPGVSAKDLAEQYRRDAESAREAGGKVVIDLAADTILVLPTEGSDEYFFQAWEKDEFLDEMRRHAGDVLDYVNIQDYILAQSQHW